MFEAREIEAFRRTGYAVARELFPVEEVVVLRDHYMALRAAGAYPGDSAGVDPKSDDPRMDGSVVSLRESTDGGPCGVWVEADGTPVVEVANSGA